MTLDQREPVALLLSQEGGLALISFLRLALNNLQYLGLSGR